MSHTTDIASEEVLRERALAVRNLGEYFAWEAQCNELIESLEERVSSKRMRLTTGYHHSINSQIIRLEGLRQATRQRFVHSGGELNNLQLTWREIETAFTNRVLTGAVINQKHILPRDFLQDASELIIKQVTECIRKYSSVKVNTEFNGEFAVGDQHAYKTINTANVELFETSDLREWYEDRVIEPTLAALDEFQDRDSGWTLIAITNLTININKYNPMRAGCNFKLSRKITSKRAVVNVKSNDNACFAWAVVAALYPAERNSDRISSYPHYSTVLNVRGLIFPLALNQIKKFEKLNEVSVNVYMLEGEKFRPIRICKGKKQRHANLLFIEEKVGGRTIGHFACIKNLARLVGTQLNANGHRKFICDR